MLGGKDKVIVGTAIGLGAIGVSVAAWSSHAQFMLARMVGVPPELAWVLPMSTDVAVLVATCIYISARYQRAVRLNAGMIALVGAFASVLLSSIYHAAVNTIPTVELKLIVGGIPTLCLAAVVHLAAMLPRNKATSSPDFAPRLSGEEAPMPPAPTAPPVTGEGSPAPVPLADSPAASGAGLRLLSGGNTRERMLAHLEQHPGTTGAELDRLIGIPDGRKSGYGRKIVREFKNRAAAATPAIGE